MADARILIVYNADSGLVPLVRDWLVKMLRPAAYPCRLCALTYGPFRMHRRWAEVLAGLPAPPIALHRDEWQALAPGDGTALPAILQESAGARRVLVSAEDFAGLADLDALVALLDARLAAAAPIGDGGLAR